MEHPDREVQAAITRLADALCSWERATGRERKKKMAIPRNQFPDDESPLKPQEIEHLTKMVEGLRQRANDNRRDLEGITDRLFGSRPDDQSIPERPSRFPEESIVGEIERALNGIEDHFDYIHDCIERF